MIMPGAIVIYNWKRTQIIFKDIFIQKLTGMISVIFKKIDIVINTSTKYD